MSDLDRPLAGGEQTPDQRNGVVLLGRGDLHLGRRTDNSAGHQGLPGRRARASAGTARRFWGLRGELLPSAGEGSEPYPLAEGMQDQQIALAIEESADSDATVTTSREAWR